MYSPRPLRPTHIEADDCAVETSTAPTTPDGSQTFSPVIQAANLQDAFERSSISSGIASRMGRGSGSSATMDLFSTAPLTVRNICCVGAGYVGGPTSAVIAFSNPSIRVNVVDKDPARIAAWKSRHLPIHETGLSEIVRIARDGSNACKFWNGPGNSADDRNTSDSEEDHEISVPARKPNLFFSTDVAKCISEADIILITVNTPTKRKGRGAGRATDMTALEGATREIALHARPGAILVEKSTVPCGTAQLIQDTLQIHRPGVDFEILSNPEFLAEGTAINDLLYPDRVIIGSADTRSGRRAAATLAAVYANWVPSTRITTINTWSSELSKLVANAMLAQRISSINSISAICEKNGADIEEIALSVGLDPRIGPKYLKSSVGFGGSCFKKDILSLIYLSESLDLPEVGEYWQQVLTLNDYQRNRFAQRVIRCMNNTLIRKKITLLGYAFKKNTSDTRESPAIDVINILLNDCPAEIAIFDPLCNPETVKEEIQRLLGSDDERLLKAEGGPVEVYTDVYEACRDSNAVVILTEWDEFRNAPIPSKSKDGAAKAAADAAAAKAKAQQALKPRKVLHPDPRPFANPEPSESDLFALHKYLSQQLSSSSSSSPSSTTSTSTSVTTTSTNNSLIATILRNANNPLQRYIDEPACSADCKECARVSAAYSKAGEQLDWIQVSKSLKSPKWVFDGRGIINVSEMEKLGVRVEAIGKAGRSGV